MLLSSLIAGKGWGESSKLNLLTIIIKEANNVLTLMPVVALCSLKILFCFLNHILICTIYCIWMLLVPFFFFWEGMLLVPCMHVLSLLMGARCFFILFCFLPQKKKKELISAIVTTKNGFSFKKKIEIKLYKN